MSDRRDDLEGLLARLIHAGVDFVVIGGFAAMAHGSTLLTRDLDVCCDFSYENLQRLARAMDDITPVHRTPSRPPLEITGEMAETFNNLYLDTEIGQIDCLSQVKGIGEYEDVERSSRVIEHPAGPCRVLELGALIASKRAMDRPRDHQAVIELEAIRERRGKSPGPDAPDNDAK